MSTESTIPSRIKTTWLIGILLAFAIFAVVAGYSGHMTRTYPGYDQQRTHDRYITLQKVQAEQNAILNAPADWIDKDKKIIHIPIEAAMAKEVVTLKSQSPQIGSALPVTPPPAPTKPETAAKPEAVATTNAAPAKLVAPAKPAAPAKSTK